MAHSQVRIVEDLANHIILDEDPETGAGIWWGKA